MSVRSEVELLRQVPLFADVEPAQLQILVFSAEHFEVEAQQTLFAAGSLVGAGHLVLDGQGEVLKPEAGEDEQVALVGTGAFLAELAMIANLPVSVTVRARTPMRVSRIGHDLFLRVCGEFPEFGAKVLAALTSRLDTSLEDLRQAKDYFDRARPFSRS
jgi:CRP/FNR family transcriptional regulator, cyclic AMP receptor protein